MILALTAAALSWPVSTTVSRSQSSRDRYLPACHFSERHEVRIHATPAQVLEALRAVTFDEVPAFNTLSRIRASVMGRSIRRPPRDLRPILAVTANPNSGFLAGPPRRARQ